MTQTMAVIDREKLLDTLGLEADTAEEQARDSWDGFARALLLSELFDLVAKFPYEEKAE